MRYLITGGSGYIGSRLTARLAEREDTERVLICDVRAPRAYRPKVEHRVLDVRDGAAVREAVAAERPDALVHLAFVLNPSRDSHLTYDIDVNGTHNVLQAAADAEVGQVLVTSSAVAYGAFPDNPVPISEDWPVRGVAGFEYAREKAEADRLCQLWALAHPDRTMTIVRPCIVFGPNVDNYLVRLWTNAPFQADLGGPDSGVQFVHEDDVVEAIARLLKGRHEGAYNVAGDGVMPAAECAQMIGVPRRRLPYGLYRRFVGLMWALRLAEAPPGSLAFTRFPWIVSNEKVKSTLDWTPRYTSREAFEITMRAKGKLGGGDQPPSLTKPEVHTPVGA
jgi:UDP-glucose 4-epimerase